MEKLTYFNEKAREEMVDSSEMLQNAHTSLAFSKTEEENATFELIQAKQINKAMIFETMDKLSSNVYQHESESCKGEDE